MSITKVQEMSFDVIAKFGPFFAKIDDPDHMYIYFLQNQDKNYEILKISNSLEIKKRFFIKGGVGPGEAQNPRIYGGDSHSVVVYDAPLHKYIKFDSTFKLVTEYRKKNRGGTFLYSGGKYLPEKGLIIDGFEFFLNYNESMIKLYSMKMTPGKIATKDTKLFQTTPFIATRKDDKKSYLSKPIGFVYAFNHIYILDKGDYRLIKADINGTVLMEKRFAFKSKSFPESDRKKWVEKFFNRGRISRKRDMFKRFDYPEKLLPACWLMPIADGIAVGKCENYDPNDPGPISADYFDRDLNFLGTITIPYFKGWNQPIGGHIEVYNSFLSRDGKLYQLKREDDDCKIEVWKVQIEKN